MHIGVLAMAAVLASTTAAASKPVPVQAPAKENKVMKDPRIVVVEDMIQAWNDRDWKKVGDLFTEDGVLHSMMIEPVKGRTAIAARISALGAGIDSITLHIRNIGIVGEVVVIERVDEFVYNGHHGKVPVVGVLEVENGGVKEWREYYDRAELLAEMGVAKRADPVAH
jgi:limonene-1,2-epoxide hydrolase